MLESLVFLLPQSGDQLYNARKMVELGVGNPLNKGFNTTEVKKAVIELLCDADTYSRAAKYVADKVMTLEVFVKECI